jgi:large subunit ribosomal protein L21
MFAVVRTGGKQYKVKEGDRIVIEKIEAEPEAKIVLDDVLLISGDDKFEIGMPKAEATVLAKVLRQFRGDKVRVYKARRKTGYRRTYGHRQYLSEILIEKIQLGVNKTEEKSVSVADKPKRHKAKKVEKPS